MELNNLPLLSLSKSSCHLPSRRLSILHFHHHWSTKFQSRYRAKTMIVNVIGEVRNEDIVIVGAGIAGLATAVSLLRYHMLIMWDFKSHSLGFSGLGIQSTVIEQAESLRTGGTSLTLFKNGWKVLDAIGVGTQLRNQCLEIQGMVIKSEGGRELKSFIFKEEDKSQEVRAIERRVLLETLANQLPRNAISYSSKLAEMKNGEGETLLKLQDGTQLSAKIVIACDGSKSPVAKWMGYSEPKYVGHCAYRGLASYPNGQPFEPRLNYIYGKGILAGFSPISPTKVYWFVCFNSPSLGPRITDPSVLREQALELVKNWSSELLNVIECTPDNTIIRTPLVDRWLWPMVSPPASTSNVVLVGDAWHPMTPNLGQGACCALEDAVVLAKKLAGALKNHISAEDAFRTYERERWPRIFPLAIRSNLLGTVLQCENPLVYSVRNNIVIPKLVRLRPVLEHTNFEFEPLL